MEDIQLGDQGPSRAEWVPTVRATQPKPGWDDSYTASKRLPTKCL